MKIFIFLAGLLAIVLSQGNDKETEDLFITAKPTLTEDTVCPGTVVPCRTFFSFFEYLILYFKGLVAI